MKKVLVASLLTSMILGSVGLVQAAEVISDSDGKSDVKVEITRETNPEIPNPGPDPIDPENPGPVDPNPNAGDLAIRYIADIDFGTHELELAGKTVTTKTDAAIGNGQSSLAQAVVQDFRNTAQRDGWNLTVKHDGEIIPGSELRFEGAKFNDFDSENPSLMNKDLVIVNQNLTINDEVATFVSADDVDAVGMAPVYYGEASLEIPANTDTGEYATTLTWNLSSGPVS